MRKYFLKILLVILVIVFFKACVTYRTKGKYTINSHEKYNIEKFTKIPNLKSVDILYSGKINFILYDNTCNLVLRKIEIYYKNKLLGRTNININICKLENLKIQYVDKNNLENLNESENSKFYSLQNFLLEVFGKENEKIELDHTNTGEYYFYIYIKDTNINKEYKIEKIESIFFEKKGFDIFVPNI